MSWRRRSPLLTLLLSSYFIFFGSMLISARSFYAGKPLKLRDAMISGLLSPSDNPRGYRIAGAGTAICGLLLLPVAVAFYRALLRRKRAIALIGATAFGLGALSAIAILFFASDINDTHVYLAFAAYIFMTAGLLLCLALEVLPQVRRGGLRGIPLTMALLSLAGVLTFLLYLLFTPDFFNDTNLLHNVAFCEWTLCAILAAGILSLAGMLTRPTR